MKIEDLKVYVGKIEVMVSVKHGNELVQITDRWTD